MPAIQLNIYTRTPKSRHILRIDTCILKIADACIILYHGRLIVAVEYTKYVVLTVATFPTFRYEDKTYLTWSTWYFPSGYLVYQYREKFTHNNLTCIYR